MAKMWYVTDGTFHTHGAAAHISIYACNEEHRPEYVCSLLEEHGFATRYHGHGQFALTAQASQDFLTWIGDAPPGFEYKWVDHDVQYEKVTV